MISANGYLRLYFFFTISIVSTIKHSTLSLMCTVSVSGQFQTLGGSKSTEAWGGRAQHIESEAIARGGRNLGDQLRARPVAMKTVVYCESLKHIVHQNHHNKSSQGA
ncbi:hypothetical protein Tco_1123752 [Tanacetum coccineum]|uniref:Secreted protein n=1 Tax=Tanacetum coccineum TaxID=301880 RepID=A0ABQ5J735_9ASTR